MKDFPWEQLEMGEVIKANASADDIVFSSKEPWPMMLYYAKRRILYKPTIEDALKVVQDIK